MYPKVKVRQEEEEEEEEEEEKDEPEFQRIFVKDFQPLLHLYNHPSKSPAPVAEHKDGYTQPHVRFSNSHTSTSGMADSKISAMKVAHENKPNTKQTSVSVLPPRAVLSSPENDVMHGIKTKTKTKTKAERSGLKNHNLCQNTHVKCNKSYEAEKRRSSWK